MMKVQAGRIGSQGELTVTVSGEFGFEAARELLFLCKARWAEGARTIFIEMQDVTGMSSSGVGTLVLISELAGNKNFHIRLRNCSDGIRDLFESGMLDKYFQRDSIVYCNDGVNEGEAQKAARSAAAGENGDPGHFSVF